MLGFDLKEEKTMKQLSKEKYQIAWFKLSEFVKKGEKERALGIYRLLIHSIDDPAFAKQLEGDLLLFFDEPTALESYVDAADRYQKMGKLAQATAIYEHLVMLAPENTLFIKQLAKLYRSLNHPTRIQFSMQRLIKPIIKAKQISALQQAFEHIMPILNEEEQAVLYQTAVEALLKHDRKNTDTIMPLVELTINSLKQSNDQLKKFIARLGAIDKDYQQEAIKLSKKIS